VCAFRFVVSMPRLRCLCEAGPVTASRHEPLGEPYAIGQKARIMDYKNGKIWKRSSIWRKITRIDGDDGGFDSVVPR